MGSKMNPSLRLCASAADLMSSMKDFSSAFSESDFSSGLSSSGRSGLRADVGSPSILSALSFSFCNEESS